MSRVITIGYFVYSYSTHSVMVFVFTYFAFLGNCCTEKTLGCPLIILIDILYFYIVSNEKRYSVSEFQFHLLWI